MAGSRLRRNTRPRGTRPACSARACSSPPAGLLPTPASQQAPRSKCRQWPCQPTPGRTRNPVAAAVGFAQGARRDGATCRLPGAVSPNSEKPCLNLPKNTYGHKHLAPAPNHATLCLATRKIRQFMAYTASCRQRNDGKNRHVMPYFQPGYALLHTPSAGSGRLTGRYFGDS